MKFSPIQVALMGIGAAILIAIILLFTGVIPGLRHQTNKITATINVWGIFDDQKAVEGSLVADFEKQYPNVKVNYTQIDDRTYEQTLVNALAAGNGPDVFMVKNTWLLKHADKLMPFSPTELPMNTMASLYPDIVLKDFTDGKQVYALPLYLDSLALFYNKTIFDNAGIATPPSTWEDFQKLLPRLTRFDSAGRITQAGAAIGASSHNINEATDLLSLIMLQKGTQMVSPDLTQATFSRTGLGALNFYVNFVNPASSAYTWDPTFHYSVDAFGEESVAMIFDYQHEIALLKQKNPFLNFAVVPMLQFAGTGKSVNYANYFGFGVSNKTTQAAAAKAFVLMATTDQQTNLDYLNAALRTPALRSLITSATNDPTVGVFATQALTATDWPQVDATAVDTIFTQMLDQVTSGQVDTNRGLRQAEASVTQLLQQRFPAQ